MNCSRCVLFGDESFSCHGDCNYGLSIVFRDGFMGNQGGISPPTGSPGALSNMFVFVYVCVVPARGWKESSRLVMCK